MRTKLVFLRNGIPVEVEHFSPDTTLLDYLRLSERKTGTKEGCNEGDCGACTVSLGRIRKGKLCYEPVNACILLLGQVDGADIITVDDLARGQNLHPVQKAMVDHHGSQCGYCTPGFVMSLFAMHHSGEAVTRQSINDFIAGNLCRCTGYRPIVDAAKNSVGKKPKDELMQRWDKTEAQLLKMQGGKDLFVGSEDRFFAAPSSVKNLSALSAKYPDATIVSGATDVGLWVTKHLKSLPQIIHVGRAKGFDQIKNSANQLVLGAGVTYRDGFEALAGIDPDMREVLRRLGSRHVRASGTIGGNIANGSPIGDMAPMLIALGAKIELLNGAAKRTINLEDFFIAYGKQDRRAGELLGKIIIPKLGKAERFRAFKISKRLDQDISAVMFGIKVKQKDSKIVEARLACGGMAGTPLRAGKCETALKGVDLLDEAGWENAIKALEHDYKPMSDMRASARYRMDIVQNLLRKSLGELSAEMSGKKIQTRLIGIREAS